MAHLIARRRTLLGCLSGWSMYLFGSVLIAALLSSTNSFFIEKHHYDRALSDALDGIFQVTLWALVFGIIVYTLYIITQFKIWARLRQHNREVRAFADHNHYELGKGYNYLTQDNSFVSGSSLDRMGGGSFLGEVVSVSLSGKYELIDRTYENIIIQPDWTYADLRANQIGYFLGFIPYRKFSQYAAIVSVRLSRSMPNVFFDSKNANTTQAKMLFIAEQILGFEGDFDSYFTVYKPYHYEIDVLSFITPEIMQALKQFANYDVEIKGDRLYLSAPLRDTNQQIPDMVAKARQMQDILAHNLATYRDSYAEGNARSETSEIGIILSRSILGYFVSMLKLVPLLILLILLIWMTPMQFMYDAGSSTESSSAFLYVSLIILVFIFGYNVYVKPLLQELKVRQEIKNRAWSAWQKRSEIIKPSKSSE